MTEQVEFVVERAWHVLNDGDRFTVADSLDGLKNASTTDVRVALQGMLAKLPEPPADVFAYDEHREVRDALEALLGDVAAIEANKCDDCGGQAEHVTVGVNDDIERQCDNCAWIEFDDSRGE